MKMIRTSIFELFKIGPGPSSSHTVGPMIAAHEFRKEILGIHPDGGTQAIQIELYGSLAATGIGHGTHRAILSGLYGDNPESVDIDRLNGFFENGNTAYSIPFGDTHIDVSEKNIIFNYGSNPYEHPNSLKFTYFIDGNPLIESVFFSVGGGFIQKRGSFESIDLSRQPAYRYSNMGDFIRIVESTKLLPERILLENEMSVSGADEKTVYEKIDRIIDIMITSVKRGMLVHGVLPGGLKVHRRAKAMIQKARLKEKMGDFLTAQFSKMNAYALAVSEENAAGHMVVTAPTNGAAGVFPAAVAYLKKDRHIDRTTLQNGLIIGALIGFIVKANASISGAELGCQAEVGTATAMAAALFSYCFGEDIYHVVSAAEIAIEHSLGMTCDPIGGLVQIPCIERNATGVIKAYNAYLLASSRDSQPLISFDQVVEVMRQTGIDLSEKYKETAKGGLATHFGWGNMPGS